MKKFLMATTAIAAMAGSASAADLAARPYTKAPVVAAPVASWTGCYIAGGGGGAMTKNDHNDFFTATNTAAGPNTSSGADGWFGTVGAGCDYQYNNFVLGLFGDYDFMSVKGDTSVFGQLGPVNTGEQKMDWQWAVGGRVGYLVLPQLLTYVSGGYTQGHWKSADLRFFGVPGIASTLPGSTKGGWFIGTGDEYALGFMPGLFWKTEYRYSEFDRSNVGINFQPGNIASGFSETQKFREHSVRSELVYRFNWGGPVIAKY